MSWWKKATGHSWTRVRNTVSGAVVGAVSGAIVGGVAGGPWGAVAGAVVGGVVGGVQGAQTDDNERKAKDEAQRAEAAAKRGTIAETEEATTTADTAGDNAYKRKQQAQAAAYANGRGGTNITSSLGGGGSLG